MSFLSKIELIDNSPLYFDELKVKHLKTICKSLLGDDPDPEILFLNLDKIISSLTNLDLKKINFIDYFIILINLRSINIGSKIALQLAENTTGEVNLLETEKTLKSFNFKEILSPSKFDDIEITYKLPTINDLVKINNEGLEEFYAYFLNTLKIKENQLIFTDAKEANLIFNKIPPKISTAIINKIKFIIQNFNELDLLSYNPYFKDMKLYFNFNIKNLCIFIKLLFGDQLLSIYENIFGLCKSGNFTPEYIENCTPGEYILFIKKIEELNKINTQQSSTNNVNVEGEPLNSYDSINPYESGDLPPITSEFAG